MLAEYRKQLVTIDLKAQEDYDKTVLALSGGALGISLNFAKDVLGQRALGHPHFLLLAWGAWIASVSCVLASYYASQLALRRAIAQVDDGTIYDQPAGGGPRRLTAVLNALGALLFLLGVLAIVAFAAKNLG